VKPVPSDLFGFGRQPATLIVIEPGPLAQLLLEDLHLFLEILDGVLLVTVEPFSEADDQQLESIHRAMLCDRRSQTRPGAHEGLCSPGQPGEFSDIAGNSIAFRYVK